MKKDRKILGIIILLIVSIASPTTVFAEQVTFGQIQDEYNRAKKELDENKASINDKEHQIDVNNETIKSLKQKIEEMSNEAAELQQQIADSNVEIESKKEETKRLITYLQMSQGENIYLEYIFGGTSITDLVYRFAVVEQITEHNDKLITDLQTLITNNENRKVELSDTQEKYKKKTEELNSEISKLNSSISKLGELSPSLEQEVETKRKLVAYYKSEGCKNRTDVIGRDCAVTTSNATFSRPIKTGYITSFVGYRGGVLHRGLDMGSSLKKNTPLYSIGNGVITSIWQDKAGAKNINVEYKTTDGKYYTAIYAHLSRYANGLYEGKKVDTNTILGYMGDTGYSFGVHLHLEVWPCRLYADAQCKTWNKYVSFVNSKYKEGFKGAESVISFPKRTYQTWYSK